MFSNPATAALSNANFTLIREVLRGAGLRGVHSLASSDVKRKASIFLTAEFHRGSRTKSALSQAISRRGEQVSIVRPSKEQAIARWTDEGGQ
jgi:hypothetical protein